MGSSPRGQDELDEVMEGFEATKKGVEEVVETGEAEGESFELYLQPEELEISKAALGEGDDEYSDDEGNNTNMRKLKYIALAMLLLAAVGGIIVALSYTVWKKEDDSAPRTATDLDDGSSTSTVAPTSALFAYILGLLLPHTSKEVLLDNSTPQGQAFLQLVSEAEATGEEAEQFRVLQRYALMALYFSTNGSGWNNRIGWNRFTENECLWFGVDTCRMGSDGSLAATNLDLSDNALLGTIPSEICILGESLEKINLGANALMGTIPTCVVEYRNLLEMDLSSNRLSGGLPTGLLTIPTLQVLELYNNALSFGLDVLFNETPEAVTAGDTSANTLLTLRLESNSLDGTVPVKLASFSKLQTLMLNSNDLEGLVNREVCTLTDAELEFFEVDCLEVFCDCCSSCLV